MEGFWYERPVNYKEEWDKLYQAVKSSEATAHLNYECDEDNTDDKDKEDE